MPPHVIDVRSADDSRDVVHRAVQALAEGQLVAFPTETVYGLAANARNPEAVERLAIAKGRAADHPFALAVKSADDALDYVPDMSPLAKRLARRCWPGPVTLVLDDRQPDSLLQQLPEVVRQALVPQGTVGLRVPAHALILDVLRMLAGPVALTSANRHGAPDSVSAQEVVAALADDVQLVLDDGPSRYGQPSSVVRIEDNQAHILRQGVVTDTTLNRLSSLMILFVCTGNTCRSPMAEALCRQLLAEKFACEPQNVEEHGVLVMSAGVAAAPGHPPSVEAVQVMHESGISLHDHESQPLTESLVRHADLIFTMTASHRDAILARWPEAGSRTAMLCQSGQNVSDPIGGPTEVYRRCAAQIRAEIEGRLADANFLQNLPGKD